MIVSARQVLCTLCAIEGYKQNLGRSRRCYPPERSEVHRCKALVAAAPSVRQDRVSALREAIKDANYNIDDYQVATKMVDRSLVDTICATNL